MTAAGAVHRLARALGGGTAILAVACSTGPDDDIVAQNRDRLMGTWDLTATQPYTRSATEPDTVRYVTFQGTVAFDPGADLVTRSDANGLDVTGRASFSVTGIEFTADDTAGGAGAFCSGQQEACWSRYGSRAFTISGPGTYQGSFDRIDYSWEVGIESPVEAGGNAVRYSLTGSGLLAGLMTLNTPGGGAQLTKR